MIDMPAVEPEQHKYLVDYELDGREFSVEVFATSWEEAQTHVEALRDGATLIGVLVAEVDLPL